MRRRAAILALVLLCTSISLYADKHPNTARGFDIGKPYQMNGIDNVNIFNGNLTVTIPIGQRYHVNGNLQYGLTLVYSGNVWDIVDEASPDRDGTIYPNRRSNAGLGWLVSLGRLFPPNQFPTQESQLWSYETPDGALHSLHVSLHGSAVTGDTCSQNNSLCYTRDGSYLRMTVTGNEHSIEFPDGTTQVFREVGKNQNGPWSDAPGSGIWRLREMHDRFGNSVTVNYSANSAADNPEIWTVIDGSRTQTVYFNSGKTPSPENAQSPYEQLVDRITLATFGQTTSEWRMTYAFREIGRGGPIGRGTYFPPSFSRMPFLTAFTLPAVNGVSQTYSMTDTTGSPDYIVPPGDTVSVLNGVLSGMQLPTKGWLEWDYTGYEFPAPSEETLRRSIGISQRRMLDSSHSNAQIWRYARKPSAGRTCVDPATHNPITAPAEQLVISVTSPEQVTTIHYFSIYPDDASDRCGSSPFDIYEYGLPLTRGVPRTIAGQTFPVETQFLSQETYTGTPVLDTSPDAYRVTGGTLLRSEWTAYERDSSYEINPDMNSRESQHVTTYEDDASCTGGCFTGLSRFSFDGAGHYRQTSTRSNFAPAGNFVTSFTNYNDVDLTGPWLLNRFSEQCKVEDSVARPAMAAANCSTLTTPAGSGSILSGPHVEHFCFDSNGFLARHRKLAGSGPLPNDLVTVYTGTAGNVTQEDYYGSDTQNNMPATNFCSATLPASTYSIANTYSHGALATSKYLNLPASGFLTTDNTIDANTGLVSFSRDTTGLQTAFLYDVLGRVKTMTPPLPEVPTTFTFAETSAPFVVTAQRSSSSGTIQSITEFDGFGRVSRETQTLPATTTSRITTYTGSSWINSVSQWEAAPSHYTSYVYDAFGRPLTVTAPDGSLSTLHYSGARTTTRTVNMGTTRNGSVVSQTPTSTVEIYDAEGRLSTLHDAAGNDTTYGYDVSGHLTTVSMGSQLRLFTYDGRGLLTTEQHPELNGAAGIVTYGGFDSRGHPATKLLGNSLSDFDLAYTYDAAERLRQIDQVTARSPQTRRILKTFTFGEAGSSTGKLAQDVRHNYRGTDDIKVTQDYIYRAADGKLTGRLTTIDKNTTRLQQFTQSYDYTDVGALAQLTYPTCLDPSRPCGASSLSSVNPLFSKGMLTSLPGFADITYHDDGTVNQVVHPGSITDTYEADDNAMGRPKSIAFQSYDSCTPPAAVSIGRTPAGTLTPQTTIQLTATPTPGYSTPITYQWYRVVNLVPVPISGATSPTFSEAIPSTTTYRVRLANGCGARDSADIEVPVCSPLTITAQPASQSTSPTTLSVTATGCGTLSYQWYQISGGSNIAVGGNSPTYSINSLSTTTTFWVKVTDAQNGTFINSNNAVVTPSFCTPQITDDPHDQTVDYGATVSVHVTVSGCIGKTYHWYSGQTGDTSTPLLGGTFDGSPSIVTQGLNHGPIWVRVDGDTITPVDSKTAMISVRPVAVHAALTPNTTNQITVSWLAIAHHFLVRRCANGTCDAPFTSTGISLNDVNRPLNTTYVYSIASVDAYGTASAYSNPDLATTMTFTPVLAGGVISRTHINELLTAVNLVLAASGSPAVTWSGILPAGVPAPPASGQSTTGIYAAHITALRTRMDAALNALLIPTTPYTDPQTLTVIKAVHFTDLQARIR
jgi:YD repeat-containing protein